MKKTLKLVGFAALAVCMTACGGRNANKASQDSEEAGTKAEDENVVVLFDGTSLDGWRGYNRTDLPAKWTIEDGCLKFNGGGGGEAQAGDGGDIIFDRKLVNFELTFDWKISKGGNSGVFFYAREIPNEPIYISAPEYQLLDNENHPDAKLGKDGNRMSGSLYDMLPAKPQNAKPAGEWNSAGILVFKGTVIHSQNGENVVEYHLWTPEWDALINASKFAKDNPHWPTSYDLLTAQLGRDGDQIVGGYIGLQDHGDDIWFKNIKVKILD